MPALLRQMLVIYGYYLPYCPWKWRLIKGLAKKLAKISDSNQSVTRRGVKYRLDLTDPLDRIIYYTGVHEALVTRFLHCVVQSGFTCFDVGANVGYYTLLLAKLVGQNGEVHGFEPCLDEFDRLQQNLSLNNMPAASIHRIALTDTTGRIGITQRKKGGLTRISTSANEVFEDSPCTTLDNFVEYHKIFKLHILKVDIEGAEVKFLRGGIHTISRYMPIIVIELNPKSLRVFGNDVLEIEKMLSNKGYRFYQLRRKGLKRLDPIPTIDNHINAIALPPKMSCLKRNISWAELHTVIRCGKNW